MTATGFATWIGYPVMAVTAVLLVRLFHIAGPRKYLFFAAYFLTDLLESIGVFGAPTYSARYGYVYLAGETIKAFLQIGVGVELWMLALRDYPGLARLGKRIAVYLLMGALLLAASGLGLEPAQAANQSLFARYFNSAQGALDSMIVLFIAGATVFLLWFPVTAARNTALLAGGLAVYLAVQWACLLALNTFPLKFDVISCCMLSCDLLCLLFWIWSLKLPGETATTVTGHRWNPAEAERLLNQLQAINKRLEQASRKKPDDNPK